MTTMELLRRARQAKTALALADGDAKNRALNAMADALLDNAQAILTANGLDLIEAKGTVSPVMLDRLALEYPKKPIYLSVIPGNDAAVRLYRGAGFRFTGEKDVHGEDVMRLAYSERNS